MVRGSVKLRGCQGQEVVSASAFAFALKVALTFLNELVHHLHFLVARLEGKICT